MQIDTVPTPLKDRGPSSLSDVLTFGEAMALFMAESPGSLALATQFQKAAAGAELNVAIGLSRLGLQVDYLSAVGADSFGAFLSDTMTREGINTRYLRSDPSRSTGFMLKTRSEDGSDPQIEYHRRASAASALSVSDIAWRHFPARHLHLTGIALALSAQTRELSFTLAQQAREAGALISFDPNLRPQLWRSPEEMRDAVNEMASLCDVILPGMDEARELTGLSTPPAMADFYLERGASHVIIKLGGEGAYCMSTAPPGRGAFIAGVAVERVVDTVGAGDGFAVGVISALLEGLPIVAAARRGNLIASRVIQFTGDSTGLPDRATLETMASEFTPGAF